MSRLQKAGIALVSIIVAGTAGYMWIEGWNFSDSLYMVYITMSTIGFTEVRQMGNGGRAWTALVGIAGIGTFAYAAGSLIEFAVEGTVRGYFRKRRMRAEIDRLEGHQILCGFGRVGREVAEELTAEGVSFVVVDQKDSVAEKCRAEGYRVVLGDGADDEVLEAAGARRARGLIAAVASDADNVFITLSARRLNPKLHIVARYNSDESAAKLLMAGADRALSPHSIGGRHLASLSTRPAVVDFLDVVSHGGRGVDFRLEEYVVFEGSPLADNSLAGARRLQKDRSPYLGDPGQERRFQHQPGGPSQYLRRGHPDNTRHSGADLRPGTPAGTLEERLPEFFYRGL